MTTIIRYAELLRALVRVTFAQCAFAACAVALCGATPSVLQAQIPKPPLPPTPPPMIQPPAPPTPPSRPFTPIEKEYIKRMEELQRQAAEAAKAQEKVETPEDALAKLLEEFGPNARYGFTRYFLYIYDTSDEYAYWCANLVENAAKAYVAFAKKLKLPTAVITEPMTVVIFKRKEDYEAYLKKVVGTEFDNSEGKLAGCYFPQLNRSVFFDMTGIEATAVNDPEKRKKSFEEISKEILARPNAEENLSVVVHEATPQISYNLGLFSKLGDNPAWTIEGLATLFEPPCGDPKYGGWRPEKDFPINRRRAQEFLAYAQENPDPMPVRKCAMLDRISADEPGSYPLAWATFSYLYKKNPRLLAYYLYYYQLKNASPTFSNGTQLQEFERFFGTDWDGMYLQLKVFVDAQLLQLDGVDEAEAEKQARKKHGLPEEPEAPPKGKKPQQDKSNKANADPNADKSGDKSSADQLKSAEAKKNAESKAEGKEAKTENKDKKPDATKPPKSPNDSKADPTPKKKPEKKASDPKSKDQKANASKSNKEGEKTQEDDWLDAWSDEPETRI